MDRQEYTTQDRRLLSRYVSNLDKDIYAIYNLPEEVIAVIFAYVSRSPHSFRDNLLTLLREDQLDIAEEAAPPGEDFAQGQRVAQEFHERWVVNYGHASVAEHAVVHLGVENISRLASARLELSNQFLSFTEYSQRYQQPQRGDFHVPEVLQQTHNGELLELYRNTQNTCYDTYMSLFEGLCEHHAAELARHEEESDSQFDQRVQRRAFEDARYALTLAVSTHLGLTGNARALRDSLVELYSDPYRETTLLADALKGEATRLVPTLIRYADASEYLVESREALEQLAAELEEGMSSNGASVSAGSTQAHNPRTRQFLASLQTGSNRSQLIGKVQLTSWPGLHRDVTAPDSGGDRLDPFGAPSEQQLHRQLAAKLLVKHTSLNHREALGRVETLSNQELAGLVQAVLNKLGAHDMLADVFRTLVYTADFCISEANWHQFLRHSRKVDFVYQQPTVEHGHTVPPAVRKAGLVGQLEHALEASEDLYYRLLQDHPSAAPYAVTNAHRRCVSAAFSLWELYHLTNLRLKPDAQWDIRYTIEELLAQLETLHPQLVAYAGPR